MADPHDRNDETLDDDGPTGGAQPTGEAFDDGGTVADPETWNTASENAATIGSDDLPEDSLERMQKIWGGAVEPRVHSGMTIKVDDIDEVADSSEFSPSTEKFSDAEPAAKSAAEIEAEEAGDPGETLQDEDAVSDSQDRTISDDDLPRVVDDAADRTMVVDEDEEAGPVGDLGGATIPDDSGTVPSTPDATFVADDDEAPGAGGSPDRTIPDSIEAAAAADGDAADRTFVVDDEGDAEPLHTIADGDSSRPADDLDRTFVTEVDDEEDGPQHTLADGPGARPADASDRTMMVDDDEADGPQHTLADGPGARPSDDGDRTFVVDEDEDAADRTFVGDSADGSAESGSFSDPKTMNLDRAADRTMVSEGGVGGRSGDPDTWDPQEQARTYGSGGDHAHTSDDLGVEVGVTVRTRNFRQSDEVVPTFAADYEVLKELGRGGMGVVFLARQTSIDRDVAVKMLKPPKAGKKKSEKKLAQQRTKFLAEAVVTGDLDHPNIVPIYDLGTDHTGAVFYSMKCVKGTPWDDVVGKKSLNENLEIFMKACDAMAFAHNRGVIHRDLKPENVMLGDFGEVLVMDWGLALTTDQFTKAGRATKTGSIGGTPSYMAPEMAAGDIKKVGVHSDVYLMGAILYEIVAGHPPHSGADVMKCLYNAAKNEIVPTDRTGELVNIALKAMSTKARDRYRSITALQDAIRDYQSHSESIAMSMRAAEDLVIARKSNEYEDYSKAMYGFQEAYELWDGNARARDGISEARLAYAQCAMNRGDLDLAGTLLTANDPAHEETRTAILGAIHEREQKARRFAMLKRVSVAAACLLFVVVTGAAVWINGERAEALRQKGIAETKEQEAVVAQGVAESERQKAVEANDALAVQVVETEKQRDRAEDEREKADIARMKAEVEEQKALDAKALAEAEERKAKRAAFESWANQQFAEFARIEAAEQRDAAEAAQVAEAKQRQEAVTQQERAEAAALEASFSAYSAELQKDAAEYSSAVAELERLSSEFAAEQERLAKVAQEKARVAAELAQEKAEEEERKAKLAQMKEAEEREKAVIAQMKAEEEEQKALAAKEAEEYEAYVAQIGLAQAKIQENAFDSARELLKRCKPELRNWEWGRLMHLCSQSSHDIKADGPVDGIAVSPDGKLVAGATWNGKVFVWELKSGKVVHEIADGSLYVNDVAISPDGKLLATVGSDDGAFVKLYDMQTGKRIPVDFEGHEETVLSAEFSADSKRLLTSSYDSSARLWDVETGEQLKVLKGHAFWVWTARFDPSNENRVVTASQDGTAAIWDLEPNRPVIVKSFMEHDGPVFSASFSPDGKSVASSGYDKRVLVWQPDRVEAFDYVAVARGEKRERSPFLELSGHGAAVDAVRYSADGSLIVSGARDNTIRLWSADTGSTVQVFRGHNEWIRAVEFSPDGRSVVSGSKDGTVKVWSMQDYEELRVLRGRTLVGHDGEILAARFSHDGKRVVTSSRDRSAMVFDVATGRRIAVLAEGHQFLATSGVFFPDGERMATSAADNTTRIWEVGSGSQKLAIENTGRAAALDVSHDGRWLVTGAPKPPVLDENRDAKPSWSAQLWDAGTGKRVMSFDDHAYEVVVVKFSPDASMVFTGDARGTGRLWDPKTGKLLFKLVSHNARVNTAVFADEGRRLLTGSSDNTVAQWDTRTGEQLPEKTLKNRAAVLSMDVVPGGQRVVTGSDDGHIRVWSIDGGEPLAEIGEAKNNGRVGAIDVSSDGELVVMTDSSPSNTVRVWNLSDGSELTVGGEPFLDWSDRRTPLLSARFSPSNGSILTVGGADARLWDLRTAEEQMAFTPHGAVAAADFSRNGKYVVTGSWDFSAKIWMLDENGGRVVARLDGGHASRVTSARFSPDRNSTRILTTSEDGTAKLWNTISHEVVQSFVGHTGPVVHGAFSEDGTRIVTGSTDGTARVWDVATGETLRVLKGHQWGVLSAEFSEDGRFVATGSADNTARVWDLSDPDSEPLVLRGHTSEVTSVAVSPDGTRVLTGSKDDTVKLWDAKTAKEILTLDRHTEPVTAVAFSSDGRFVLTGSRDGTAIIWLATDWVKDPAVAEVRREAPMAADGAR